MEYPQHIRVNGINYRAAWKFSTEHGWAVTYVNHALRKTVNVIAKGDTWDLRTFNGDEVEINNENTWE